MNDIVIHVEHFYSSTDKLVIHSCACVDIVDFLLTKGLLFLNNGAHLEIRHTFIYQLYKRHPILAPPPPKRGC